MPLRKCSGGTIRRKAYTRKSGVKVRSSCIRDAGKPGKGKKLFSVRPGQLSSLGYKDIATKSARSRHTSLNRAIKKYGATSVVRKLNALYVLNKNTNRSVSSRARADRNWVSKSLRRSSSKRRTSSYKFATKKRSSSSRKKRSGTRQGPSDSATRVPIGTIAKGLNGGLWKVKANKNGTHRWVALSRAERRSTPKTKAGQRLERVLARDRRLQRAGKLSIDW